jgi:glucan phosphoethanolaminetransferase (alkaline phosphatase superfamily)
MEAEDRESRLSRIGIFILRGLLGLFILTIQAFFVIQKLQYTPSFATSYGLIGFIMLNALILLLPICPPMLWKITARALLISIILFLLIDVIWIVSGRMTLDMFVRRWSEGQSLGYAIGAFLMMFFVQWMALLLLVPLRRPEKSSDENYWL